MRQVWGVYLRICNTPRHALTANRLTLTISRNLGKTPAKDLKLMSTETRK